MHKTSYKSVFNQTKHFKTEVSLCFSIKAYGLTFESKEKKQQEISILLAHYYLLDLLILFTLLKKI